MSVVLRMSTEEHLREIKDSKARREIHVDQLAVVENWDGPSTDLFKTNGKLTQHFTRRLEDDDGLVTAWLPSPGSCTAQSVALHVNHHRRCY